MRKSNLIIAAALVLAACGPKVDLPDPTIEYPAPPSRLMEPAKQPTTIPTENKQIADSN